MTIYLMQQYETNLYKIGITKKDPEKRLKELQTGNANELILIKTFETKFDFKMEASLHACYRMQRKNSEWFELNEQQINDFEKTCLLYESNFTILKKSNNPFI